MTTELHAAVAENANPPAAVHDGNLETHRPRRPRNLGAETTVALAGTGFSAILLTVAATHAGPLWRDETNTINVALMPSLKALWSNLQFESFPPLWPLTVRGLGLLGVTHSDAGIRMLGLCVGLSFLVSLWLCSRWMGGRAPILSIALLGSLPAFIFIVGANRAYGLGCCLLVLSFGMIWRMLQRPSASQVFGGAIMCLLFAQCVYYDGIFLCAMLLGGAVVAFRRRQWKTLWLLSMIGGLSGVSMVIYLPVTRRAAAVLPLIQEPLFNASAVWHGFARAVSDRTSARPGAPGSQIWIWVMLTLGALLVAAAVQRAGSRQVHEAEPSARSAGYVNRDLALFCLISMLFALAAFVVFLIRLQFFVQSWYCVESLTLCAISLDGILSMNWPSLAPWGLLRIGFMVVMMILMAGSAWQEAQTRRSNVDVAAAILEREASPGDLIVMQDAWEGITFDRYYHGRAPWVTVPPIDSHKVHRNDLVRGERIQRDPMASVLNRIPGVLRSNHSVWLVGSLPLFRPKNLLPPPPPPPSLPTKWWLGTYLLDWNAEVMAQVLNHARQGQVLKIPVTGPVSYFENVSVVRFSGFRNDAK